MIYIASPYTHKNKKVMQQRYEEVVALCAYLAKEGHSVYSPIAHWHPIALLHDLPRDKAWWKVVDEDMIVIAKQLWVLMLDGWRASKGIAREILFAKNNAIRVKYIQIREGDYKCIT